MPQPAKQARLYLRKARYRKDGSLRDRGIFIIRDGRHFESTGCGPDDATGAERALEAYLNRKHAKQASQGPRSASSIPVADVIDLYARDKGPNQARPREVAQRSTALLGFFGDDMLSDITGARCREYTAQRGTGAARRELEDLRAAVNHYHREGLCHEVVAVSIPERGPSRERWLTRSEAAAMIWAAWRYREKQNHRGTDRMTRRHIARFMLVAFYTGTRASPICGAALMPTIGRAYIDTATGMFYRRPAGEKETNKRKPPIRLPDRLLAHLRRWKRLGQRFAVEWNGQPVKRVSKAFAAVRKDAGLGPDVTPHILRHTAITWAMQNRADKFEASGYFGVSLETLERVYAHHHPDHQNTVRKAVVRR